jgi:PleD family two-component response regulator
VHPDGAPQTVSVGISERLHDKIENADSLIQQADTRLYEAKSSGRWRAVGAETVVFPAQRRK